MAQRREINAILVTELTRWGKFLLQVKEDADKNRFLFVVVELTPGLEGSEEKREAIATSIQSQLLRLNSEFAKLAVMLVPLVSSVTRAGKVRSTLWHSPNLNCMIITATSKGSSIRTDDDGINSAGMPCESAQQFPSAQVP